MQFISVTSKYESHASDTITNIVLQSTFSGSGKSGLTRNTWSNIAIKPLGSCFFARIFSFCVLVSAAGDSLSSYFLQCGLCSSQ
jgi:hypothetical protein